MKNKDTRCPRNVVFLRKMLLVLALTGVLMFGFSLYGFITAHVVSDQATMLFFTVILMGSTAIWGSSLMTMFPLLECSMEHFRKVAEEHDRQVEEEWRDRTCVVCGHKAQIGIPEQEGSAGEVSYYCFDCEP